MCLAQGPQRSDAGEAQTATSRSQVKRSTTEPLRSLDVFCDVNYVKCKKCMVVCFISVK